MAREIRVVDHENIQRAQLRVETRLKAAAEVNPAKYGEKLDVNSHNAEPCRQPAVGQGWVSSPRRSFNSMFSR